MKQATDPTTTTETRQNGSGAMAGTQSAPAKTPKWRALRLLPMKMAPVVDNPIYRLLSGTGQNRGKVIAWSGLAEGQDVLELGCGPGYYTPAIADRIGPEAKVYAVDIQKGMIERVSRKVERAGIKNAVPLVAAGARLPLADNSVDFIWALYVFEEVVKLERTIAELHRVLRPGGTVAIAQVGFDFKEDQKEAMRHFFPRGGFELIDEHDGRWMRRRMGTYRVRFRKA